MWTERQKFGKKTGEGYHSGCSDYVFYYIYNYIRSIMDLDVDVGKLPNHLKLCVMYSDSILSSNSLQWTENLRAVKFDAVPL